MIIEEASILRYGTLAVEYRYTVRVLKRVAAHFSAEKTLRCKYICMNKFCYEKMKLEKGREKKRKEKRIDVILFILL